MDKYITRSVRIFRPTRTTMQAGARHPQIWRLEWDFTSSRHWENPVMGWTSSGDPLQATYINFPTLESAIRFAEKQGYSYQVEPDSTLSKFAVKSYADNYRVETMNPSKISHTK
ncbi:hypothetical protein T552_02324 [Pneumocystis carinii B80]|uniref:NADH dehydrogenase [ubiquinone] iron-sulfur protein 4, mitochondrial n=1 Tax=Pneumocystis carinii (strain B80) TaxID=1408658 RepID=A0A0W4ZG30_PNEC8|nr:hypothetical protein T552_02324 [Pneumocystis carinii B80]KTW27341.1 hypothetical protein T552_02324 [Pneumocystis carinii B80]